MFFLRGKVIDHYINLYENKEALKNYSPPVFQIYLWDKCETFFQSPKLKGRTIGIWITWIGKESSFKTQEGTQKNDPNLHLFLLMTCIICTMVKCSWNHHSGKYLWIFYPGIKQNPIQQKDMMNFTFTFFLGVALGGSSRDRTWFGSPPCISHVYPPFGRGPTTLLRWRTWTMVIKPFDTIW